MIIVDTIAELRRRLARIRSGGQRIALVPTMGYLHEGHLVLVDHARRHAEFVVLSIFVNPLQFGPGEDLDRYPRDLGRDTQLAEQRRVDLLFTPSALELYPEGAPKTQVSAPALSDRLCGWYRPGHFAGVLTVVAKLFNEARPDVAVFGQKDLQQSVLIRRMVRDLDFDIDIVIVPIVRDADGLALSSRNSFLDEAQRRAAGALSRALRAAQTAFTAGEDDPSRLLGVMRAVLAEAADVNVQYVELVDAATLDPPPRARPGDALAVAAYVGTTRLIDNHLLS